MKEAVEISNLSIRIAKAYAEISYENTAHTLQQLRKTYLEAEAAFTQSLPLGELLKEGHSSLQTVKDDLQVILEAANKESTELKQIQARAKTCYQQYPNKNPTVASLEPLVAELEGFAAQVKTIKTNLGQKSQKAKGLSVNLRKTLYDQVNSMQSKARTYKDILQNAFKLYLTTDEITQGKALKQAQNHMKKLQTHVKAIEAKIHRWPHSPFSEDFELLKSYWLQTRVLFLSIEKLYKEADKLNIEIEKQRKLIQFPEAPALAEHAQMKSLASRIIQHWIYHPCQGMTELVAFLTSAYTALPAKTELEQFHALSVFIQDQKIGEDLHLFAPNQRIIPQQIWYDALKQYLEAILQDEHNYQKKAEKDYFFYTDLLFSAYENGYEESLELRILRIKELLLTWAEAARKLHRVIEANLQLELYQEIHAIFQNELRILDSPKSELLTEINKAKQESQDLTDRKELARKAITDLDTEINSYLTKKAPLEACLNKQGGKEKIAELENKLISVEGKEQDRLTTQLRDMLPLQAQIEKYISLIKAKEKEKQKVEEQIAALDNSLKLSAMKQENLWTKYNLINKFKNVLETLSQAQHIKQADLQRLSKNMSSYTFTSNAGPVIFNAAGFWPQVLGHMQGILSSPRFFDRRLRIEETASLQAALSNLSNGPSTT